MIVLRNSHNPILKPDPAHSWENMAVFNGSVVKKDTEYFIFYRAQGDEQNIGQKKLRMSVIGRGMSANGIDFKDRALFIKPEHEWEKYGCEDPRITKIDGRYFIFYTALANYPPNHLGIRVGVAISHDLKTVTEKHLVTPFNAKAMTLFPEKINGLYTALLSVNTDKPPSSICIAQFEKLETLWDESFWNEWYEHRDEHIVPLKRINSDQVEVGALPLKTDHGWLILYSYIKHYLSDNVKKEFRIESVLLDLYNPQKIIGRIEKPLLIPDAEYELNGIVPHIVFPTGGLIENDELKIYYGGADTVCAVATTNLRELLSEFEINTPGTLKCQKFLNNPLLQPITEHQWESKAVFNPAAIEINGVIYFVYRTTSGDNLSYLGLAVSYDGMYIDERFPDPIYPFRSKYEKPKKTGLPAGCEDPRITRIGNVLYMCYTAHDGELARLAMTSISVENFVNRNFTTWSEPKIISPPNISDKDGALFPEKVNGKYAFFHRIEPNIIIDTVDDLEFKNKPYLGQQGYIVPRSGHWEGNKIGINTPPLKTKDGWLVFYHGISIIDHNYRLGALLLDLNDITEVIAQTPYPVLEPETLFEKNGMVNNVVFPCGFVQRGDDILLYYGGADTVICGARINLKQLLEYLERSRVKKYLSV